MPFKLADAIKETSSSPIGTGASTVSGTAPSGGWKSFASFMSVGDTTWLTRRQGDDFETGLFQYTAANTLTPVTIFESSNGNAAVNWGAGVKTLFVDQPASKQSTFERPLSSNDTTEATGAGTTAGAIFKGGVEIAKKLFVAGAVALASTLTVAGATTITGNFTGLSDINTMGSGGTVNSALNLNGGTATNTGAVLRFGKAGTYHWNIGHESGSVGAANTVNDFAIHSISSGQYIEVTTAGVLKISANVAATSSSTGSLIVGGGAGVNGNLYVGNNINIANSATITGSLSAGSLSTAGSLSANSATVTNQINAATVSVTGEISAGGSITATGRMYANEHLFVGVAGNTGALLTLLSFNGGSASGGGVILRLNRGAALKWQIGTVSAIFSNNLDDYAIYNQTTASTSMQVVATTNVVSFPAAIASTTKTSGGVIFGGGVGINGAGYFGLEVVTGVFTVANLPAAGAARKGARAFVSDATLNTFRGAVVGGGTNNVPVHCDGTAWLIG